MVVNKAKGIKKEVKSSETVSSKKTVMSSTTGGGSSTVAAQNLPMLQERMTQKSSSIEHSSSSSKISSSSAQEQKFVSTSSTSSATKSSGKTQQLQSQSDAFLRGERTLSDIDAKHHKNGSILIESVDLQNVSSNIDKNSGIDNLVSVEIESKDSYAHHSSEFVTNTSSTFSSSSSNKVENRNDVITVESGKSKEKTAMSATAVESSSGGDVVRDMNSLNQGSNATSSSTYQEFSSSSMEKSSTENNEIKSAVSKNSSSSKTIKSADGKNLADSSTTFTSKVYDDKTKSWVVVEQSSVNEKDMILPGVGNTTATTARSSSIDNKNINATLSDNVINSNIISSGIDSASHIDSTSSSTMRNSSNIISSGLDTTHIDMSNNSSMTSNIIQSGGYDASNSNSTIKNSNLNSSTTFVDSMNKNSSLTSKSSDVQTSSKSTKEVLEKNMSSKKESNRNEKITSTTSKETIQVYDSKTKNWITVDASSLDRQTRPSYVRYRSQDDDGKWHTIYKRKLFDEFTKQWRIVDEKVVSSDDTSRLVDIPEMIENATNITTTTYTTKIYDTKTGKWKIIDEKSYVDNESSNVTQDIKREIEKDQPDLANIITTTETTKVCLNFFHLPKTENYNFLQ